MDEELDEIIDLRGFNADKHQPKQFDWLKEHQWQKGQSGNPKGRPKGKTLKEFTREFLANMSEEARIEYLKGVDPDVIWKMAEGNPSNEDKIEHSGVIETSASFTAEQIALLKAKLKDKQVNGK